MHAFIVIFSHRGYTAPEYAIRGELSEKADIYSFGVLVLEIISCRKNTDPTLPSEMHYLPEYVGLYPFRFFFVFPFLNKDLSTNLVKLL